MTGSAQARLRRLPLVRRARGYRLYTVDGRRILDLWQAGGRAILGHRGGGVVPAVKRVLERGVLAAMPSVQERRLEQALLRLLGDGELVRVAVYESHQRAVEAVAAALGLPAPQCRPDDPVLLTLEGGPAFPAALPAALHGHGGRPSVRYWRPYLPADRPAAEPRVAVRFPVLPDGGLFEAQTVVYPDELGIELFSDILPEPVLTALTAAAWGLVSSGRRPVVRLAGFSRVGPYFVPDASEDYDRVFDCFLRSGVLISPDPAVPSIVPGELSDGERACLEAAARAAMADSDGKRGTGGN